MTLFSYQHLFWWYTGFGQLTENNTPPTIYVDRNWVVQDTDPVGEVVARAKAEDPEKDPLEYGLEAKGYGGAGSTDRPLPFTINSTTGGVKINESLINRVSYWTGLGNKATIFPLILMHLE
jgi:hypothetical protein